MKIALFPYSNKSNKYLELIKESIESLDIEINDMKTVLKNKSLFKDTEYFILNWYESLYTNSFPKQVLKNIYKHIELNKLKNKKIVWVIHNKIPHDDKHKFFSKNLMKYLAKISYKIVIHSSESIKVIEELSKDNSIKNKIVYVPHPNYIGAYKDENYDESIKCDDNINLFFVGAIKPYKNVDLLIQAYNELNLKNVTLSLAGKVSSLEYENYINNMIGGNPNIKTDFRFIDDNEINMLINKSDVLVLPYDINSSLNSGTILLAFSNKRTVISPLIGTLKDFKEDELFFAYNYNTKEEHLTKLKDMITKVVEVKKDDNMKLRVMGERCYDIIKENNSLGTIADIYKNEIFK
ncbi:glycosyltransferase [Clostridium disporicum]|uniref:GDP-mannose:glycolipid 4-beta-D-mannosyltransferase n=1 Tax=Clostridium disporicum TaxID=84024 RepID=A0A174FC30_9CLOT|nr:glycosyltransferase [Clostridium disporicum]CUO46209.1 GDP-mannose:glycolipid 4-beta-D-mannosyltransferase precursor [Clostridium disporicum]